MFVQDYKKELAWGKDPKDVYFEIMDADTRLEFLRSQEETGDPENFREFRALFNQRYKLQKGKYIDLFLRSWIELKVTVESANSLFSTSRNQRAITEALSTLCLDGQSTFSEELLYKELCHLTKTFVFLCQKDPSYNTLVWGMGHISDEKRDEKIRFDLELIAHKLPEIYQMGEHFELFGRAIDDIEATYL